MLWRWLSTCPLQLNLLLNLLSALRLPTNLVSVSGVYKCSKQVLYPTSVRCRSTVSRDQDSSARQWQNGLVCLKIGKCIVKSTCSSIFRHPTVSSDFHFPFLGSWPLIPYDTIQQSVNNNLHEWRFPLGLKFSKFEFHLLLLLIRGQLHHSRWMLALFCPINV